MMGPDAKLASELVGLSDRDEYLQAASELLLKIFPGENVAWNALDAQGPSVVVRVHPRNPFPEDSTGILLEIWEDHPLVRSYVADTDEGVWSPRRLSDLVTDQQLLRTRAYREALAPLGSDRELSFLVSRPTRFSIRGWAMNRLGRDFTDGEVDLARHVQPVLRLLDMACSKEQPGQHWRGSAEEHALTPREQEILQLLGKGLTGVAIGHLLGVSPRTVAKHLEHAYAKLGCTNRIDALRRLRGE